MKSYMNEIKGIFTYCNYRNTVLKHTNFQFTVMTNSIHALKNRHSNTPS